MHVCTCASSSLSAKGTSFAASPLQQTSRCERCESIWNPEFRGDFCVTFRAPKRVSANIPLCIKFEPAGLRLQTDHL